MKWQIAEPKCVQRGLPKGMLRNERKERNFEKENKALALLSACDINHLYSIYIFLFKP
jgi:hypothetical protein